MTSAGVATAGNEADPNQTGDELKNSGGVSSKELRKEHSNARSETSYQKMSSWQSNHQSRESDRIGTHNSRNSRQSQAKTKDGTGRKIRTRKSSLASRKSSTAKMVNDHHSLAQELDEQTKYR